MARFPEARTQVIERARAQFAAADKDHDGFVTRAELMPAPPGMRAPDRPAGRDGKRPDLFAMMDKNGDGQISRAEFDAFPGPGAGMRVERRFVLRREGQPPPGAEGEHRPMGFAGRGAPPFGPAGPMRAGFEMRIGFDRLDADHDGRISATEFERMATERFDRLDANHDGTVTWAENWMGMRAMAMRMPGRFMPPLPPEPPSRD